MLEAIELSKVYQMEEVETVALNDINIKINVGEFVSIMGPSGCGKSTLLNILGMLDFPSHGHYYFLGEDVASLSEKDRAEIRKNNIGFVFQSFNLIDELNVEENIELPLIYLKISSNERKKKVQHVLERMAISSRRKHFPQQLSGGQQQRVAVARALVSNPKFILADEPAGNLDSKNGDEVMKMLSDLNKEGTTIVMVTHSSEHAKYGNRIIQLLDGKLII